LNSEADAELGKAREVVEDLARNFGSKGVYEPVKVLLESPLRDVPRLIPKPRDVTKSKITSAKQQLCGSLTTLKKKYPFDPQGKDADLADVSKVFDPKNGDLAGMRQALGDLVVKSDGIWSQKPDATIQLSTSFLKFFNRMSAISDALFPPQGGGPAMKYKLSVQANPLIKRITGKLDGEQVSMPKESSWPPSNGEIDLRVELTGGGDTPLCSYRGPWAIFRLLSSADDHQAGSSLFPLVYSRAEGPGSLRQPILADHSPIIFEVMQFPNNVRQAFDKDFFAVSCPKQIFE
jgi:type VI protein secretion system component VasK